MTNIEQLAYLAGLTDGEGCLYCIHQTYKKSNYYYPRLEITSTDKWILEWIKLLFGGNIRLDRKKEPYHKERFRWVIGCRNAVELVKCLLPYLKIKKNEAKLFIQYYNINKNLRRDFSEQLKKLKRFC